MLNKSTFFDFLNQPGKPFETLMEDGVEDEDYIDWNGFALVMEYHDSESEYSAIRNECALCDVSPLRKVRIQGSQAGHFLDRLLTRPVSDLPAMRATYTVFCNDNGTLKDDAILYKFDQEDYLLLPSDLDHRPWFGQLCTRFGISEISFTDCTYAWAGMAVQGPASASALRVMGYAGIDQLKPFEVRTFPLGSGEIHIARMGFTADLGYECWMSTENSGAFEQQLQSARDELELGIPGYGLTALQACRLEGGFIVAGWDCATEVEPNPGFERSPLELGIGWIVNLDAANFVGRDALLAQKRQGAAHTFRYCELECREQPEDGAALFDKSGTPIGNITSSAWSWGLGKTLANASLLSEFADTKEATVLIDSQPVGVRLLKKSTLNLERRNQVPAPHFR